ncbi:MAG: NAD-dependent epimerase/dehydratase family protein [Saprospiraceae bacterium]|nr:NAD-dependent epimerase/dehydratase family protein [Saprospiraceae bacterium]
MKYFLTGATGFVGGELARQLRAAGHEVIALVRNPGKATNLAALGVALVKGDVTDKESMRAPMSGCDGVFHVAGWYQLGGRNIAQGQAINVDGTRNVLELMKELGIKKGVYTSTLAVNSNTHGKFPDESYRFTGVHMSAYDRTKAEAHHIAEKFISDGLPLVILMPGLIYGPEGLSPSDLALRDFLRGRLPLIPKVTGFAWAHVADVAHAHILGMEKAAPGSTYIICGPNHTFEEGMKIASEISGKRMPLVMPPWSLMLSSWMSAAVEWLIPLPDRYRSETLRVQAGTTYYGDNSKAKVELGFNPRPLREGLKQTFKAWGYDTRE